MITKLEQLRQLAQKKEWKAAISLAAKFPRLGKEKDLIKSADMAFKHRDFCLQLKKDPDALIEAGIKALCTKYGF